MENLKDILSKLMADQISKFELVNIANKLDVDISSESSFLRQKRIVQRVVLANIIRDSRECDTQYYLEVLKETDGWLSLKRNPGFECCVAGCSFNGHHHQHYVNHLRQVHFMSNNLLCNFKKTCARRFQSLHNLEEHIRQHHYKPKSDEGAVSTTVSNRQIHATHCKCSQISCGKVQFKTISKLTRHYNSVHKDETRPCIFDRCDYIIDGDWSPTTARKHFLNKHFKKNAVKLKPEFSVINSSLVVDNLCDDDHCNPGFEDMDVDDGDAGDDSISLEDGEEIDDVREEDFVDHEFEKVYVNFLNTLSSLRYIPQSTIDTVTKQYLNISIEANKLRKAALKKVLVDEKVENKTIAKVMELIENDKLIEVQKKFCSQYLREKFIRENFKYTPPKELILNPHEVQQGKAKEVYHYVPLIPSIRNLFEDETFLSVFEESRASPGIIEEDELIKEFKDGYLRQNHPYFQKYPDAVAGAIYSDGVEIVSPLGAGKGRHKIIQLFWSIIDIPKKHRSRIDTIHLGIIVKESLVKKYGYRRIYAPLINDIKILEKEGVLVQRPFERRIRVSFPIHIGDNLEDANLGGFSGSFSSRDICRFCHIQHENLVDHIHDHGNHGKHKYWSVEEYDEITSKIKEHHEYRDNSIESSVLTDENLFTEFEEPSIMVAEADEAEDVEDEDHGSKVQYGLRHKCPFNDTASFHAVYSFPPDILHDVAEGVIAEDLLGVLKILTKKWFSEEEYNAALRKHEYKSHESSDRPELINTKKSKLKGKAMSIICHLRNIGFILSYLNVSKEMFDEKCIQMIMKLSIIVEMLTAPVIRRYEVASLEEQIIEYLDIRKELFEEFPNCLNKPKPKTHFLSHYPESIMMYGPPGGMWTARYESKHRVGKSLAQAGKNFISITKTLSERQQFREASIYYSGMT